MREIFTLCLHAIVTIRRLDHPWAAFCWTKRYSGQLPTCIKKCRVQRRYPTGTQ
jgi:hypothetical protein